MKKIKLSNGVEMPQLGYGVYQVEPDECERCVVDALSVGYRMIDTAQAYLNEEAVGNAWKKSGISRDEIFLVSKVWHSNYGEGQTMKSIDESLRKLQTDYIDLMLLHQPYCDRYGAYRDLEKAYKAGKVRAIGVSNFFPDPPRVEQKEANYFEAEDILKISECLEKEPIKWRTAVHLLLITGARRGEILGLKWDKIEWDENQIHIDNNLLYSCDCGIYEDSPKTNDQLRHQSRKRQAHAHLR